MSKEDFLAALVEEIVAGILAELEQPVDTAGPKQESVEGYR